MSGCDPTNPKSAVRFQRASERGTRTAQRMSIGEATATLTRPELVAAHLNIDREVIERLRKDKQPVV